MHSVRTHPGLLVVDTSLNVVATNGDAIQILTFPERSEKIGNLNTWLGNRVRSCLLDRRSSAPKDFVKDFRSARRTYECRFFSLTSTFDSNPEPGPAMLIILERRSNGMNAIAELSQRFGLTAREAQTVQLLVEGLTSKEIATRMAISTNTVKGFIHMVMVKMNVSTRSGIIGQIVGADVVDHALRGHGRIPLKGEARQFASRLPLAPTLAAASLTQSSSGLRLAQKHCTIRSDEQ